MAMVSVLCPSCNKENNIDSELEHFYCTHCGKKVVAEAAVAYSAIIQTKHDEQLQEDNSGQENSINSKSIDEQEEVADKAAELSDTLTTKDSDEPAEISVLESSGEMPSKKKSPLIAKIALGLVGLLVLFGLVIPMMGLKACGSSAQLNASSTVESSGAEKNEGMASSSQFYEQGMTSEPKHYLGELHDIDFQTVEIPDYLKGSWEIVSHADENGVQHRAAGRVVVKDSMLRLLFVDNNGEKQIVATPYEMQEDALYCTTNDEENPFLAFGIPLTIDGETITPEDGSVLIALSDNADLLQSVHSDRYLLQRFSIVDPAVSEPRGDKDSLGVLMPEEYRGTHEVTGARLSTDSKAPSETASYGGVLTVWEHSFYFNGSVDGIELELSGVIVDCFDYYSPQARCRVNSDSYFYANLSYTFNSETRESTDTIVLSLGPVSTNPETPFVSFYFD